MAILTVSNGHTMIWSWSRVEGFNHITQKKPSQKKMKNSTDMNINIQMGIPVNNTKTWWSKSILLSPVLIVSKSDREGLVVLVWQCTLSSSWWSWEKTRIAGVMFGVMFYFMRWHHSWKPQMPSITPHTSLAHSPAGSWSLHLWRCRVIRRVRELWVKEAIWCVL